MPDAVDFETQITALRKELTDTEREAVTKLAAADQLRANMLESGVDFRTLKADSDEFTKIDEAYKEADLLKDNAIGMRTKLDRMYGWTGRTGVGERKGGTDDGGPAKRGEHFTIGERYLKSEVWQRSRESLRGAGGASNAAQIHLDGVTVLTRAELKDLFRRRTGLDLTSGQQAVTPEFSLMPPVELPFRQPRLVELVNTETTDTDAVVWLQQTQRVRAAAPTPSGVPAPQATVAFQRVTTNVKRIPVILTAPKEVLADEGRLQGFLDRQMMEDTRLEVEDQVLAGDGTGENFTGILNTDGILSEALSGGDYDLDAIHRAITQVRISLFMDPDGIGLAPADLEKIMLQKDNFGRYIFDPAAETESIWGFPSISSTVFTEGTGIVANWRMGATLWLREDVVITATDGYTDVPTGTNYFSAGLVAILAQIRAAFAVERPFAFCSVTDL